MLAAQSLLWPRVVLDILANFALFATIEKTCPEHSRRERRIKIICRYQRYLAETVPKVLRRHAILPLECPAEMVNVGEAASFGYGFNRQIFLIHNDNSRFESGFFQKLCRG